MSRIGILLLVLISTASSQKSSDRLCKCIGFNATSGVFHSPNYPQPFQKSPCLFYHFIAPKDHIIRLVFNIFQLPLRIGKCSTSLKIYDHTRNGIVDSEEFADFEFCGKEIVAGREFYSRDEHMLLKIGSKSEIGSRGFSGTFEAVPKRKFRSDAVEMAECSYRIEKSKAMIYSPQYPYYYPSNINCTYHIPYRKGFQIVVNSIFMQIAGGSTLQVFESVEGKFERRLIEMITSAQKSLYLTASTSLVLYFSAGNNNIEKAVGFVIELQYSNVVWSQSPGAGSECHLNINSENSKDGQLSSEKIARFTSSSMPTKCQILFQGYPNEKISVKFTHFNLYVPDNKNISKRCGEVDNLSADVRVGSRLSRIDEWCGRRSPPNLMSSSNLLQLEYNTKSSKLIRESTNQDIGFRLEFKFHTDWNIGNMQAKIDKNKECRFSFNSTEHTNGKLWSPNYPGLYPRNIYCEYIFHGRTDQVVHIHFEYFDIEGFNQCDESTQSDYILFSNYQTHDRTNRRFCGKTAPKGPILSESNYFRMIFSTNDIFDGTGFYAHYQFITQEKSQISRVKLTLSSCAIHSLAPILVLSQIVLYRIN